MDIGVLLSLWIVAVSADLPIEARYPQAAEIFSCTFGRTWDENFDGWPDRWTRRQGRGFPHYVQIKISGEPSPVGDRCLRIDLDGGAAVAYSPPIRVGPLLSYVLEGQLKTEGLNGDRAHFSLTFLDKDRHRLETVCSEQIRDTQGWSKVRLGPLSAGSDRARFAVIGLHVQPQSSEDLKGTVLFDDVWLGGLPKISLATNRPDNFFTDAGQVEITCTASGFLDRHPRVTLRLEDELGRQLARLQRPLVTRPADPEAADSPDNFPDGPLQVIGTTVWRPVIDGPGFYRVRVAMQGRETTVYRQELTLVVVRPRHAAPGGEFGWTLPKGDRPLPLPLLSRLAGQAGINWLKYPLWFEDKGDDAEIEQLIAFAEGLGAQGIELVGLLHDPPRTLRDRFGQSGSPLAAEIFAPEPDVWYPSLKPVMARLALQVRWWQLGADTDTSFIGYPHLSRKIAQVKQELDRIGRDVNLGIGWSWIDAVPQATAGEAPWRFLTLSADPPMSGQELAVYLDADKNAELLRWVALRPLSRKHYRTKVRAADLVQRMVAAKVHGAEAVFCPDPFDADHGLINQDGTPGELLLPWRTAALVLGGAGHVGSIELPNGSRNQVFARDDDAVMVVWNNRPTEEVIYLGEDVRQIDLWGRELIPPKQGHRQVIRVGPVPVLLAGLSEPISRWRIGFSFARDRVASIFGRPHPNSCSTRNHFSRGVEGRATLVTPEPWQVFPKQADFRLDPAEELHHAFDVTFPFSASSGRNPIRVDFEVYGDRFYEFSVYRSLEVGLGEVYVEVLAYLNGKGELEIQQRLVNQGDRLVSFRCQLFAPGRRRMNTRIIDLGRGHDVKLYRIGDGQELIGKTLWLRAEEMDGPRVLNYRFAAEQ